MSPDLGAAARTVGDGVVAWDRAVFAPVLPAGWTGADADAARTALARLVDHGGGLADRGRRVAAVLADVAARPFDDAADARVAAALTAAARVPVPAAPGPPAGDPAPAAVARWWAASSPEERARLLAERPQLVGGLDGIPAAVRDRANRTVLAAASAAARAEEAALLDAAAHHADGDVGSRLAAVRQRLRRITAISDAVAAPGRALLAVDPVAGRAAVATGDVDTARHVGVVVPGFTASAEDLPARLTELEALRSRAGAATAVVAWYDGASPQWSEVLDPQRSVLGTRAAATASVRLASFLAGIDATHAAGVPAHVTAVGHSYGSLTVAQALPGAPGVDDVVLLGSPGVTPAPGRPVRVGEAPFDAVADTGWFGPDPNTDGPTLATSAQPARTAPSGVAVPATTASVGHGAYLRPGSTSAENVAAVIGGRSQDVVLEDSVGAGDRLRGLFGRDALRPGS